MHSFHSLLILAALTSLGLSNATQVFAQELPQVPVAARTLERGAIIGAADIEKADITVLGARQTAITDPRDLVGKQLRRSVRAGQPFIGIDVKEPDLVRKGDTVSMVLRNGNLAIATAGRALEDGARDQVIKVQNIASRKVVEGRVSGAGSITILPFTNPLLSQGQ
jgi:flagellar basal body P-ring formation protein FlgA